VQVSPRFPERISWFSIAWYLQALVQAMQSVYEEVIRIPKGNIFFPKLTRIPVGQEAVQCIMLTLFAEM